MKISPFTYQSFAAEEPATSPVAVMDVEGEIDIIEETVVVTFDEDEMEVAKKASYDDGFMAGKKEGIREAEMKTQQHQNEISTVLSGVETSLKDLHQQYDTAIATRQSELGRLVLACAEKIAGEALRKDPASDINEMIGDCVEGLFDSPEITASVHPDLVPHLQQSLPKTITITADETLQLSDCRLNWQHGQAMRDSTRLWDEVEQIIERHFDKPSAKISPEPIGAEQVTDNPTPTPEQPAEATPVEAVDVKTPTPITAPVMDIKTEAQGENNE